MLQNEHTLEITPDTRIGALLEKYPKLENFLLELSPAFARLKNPLLRKTVGKIATLRQVAAIGNIPLGTLINSLRAAAGLTEIDTTSSSDSPDTPPEWYDPGEVVKSLDAAPILAAGEHPLGTVMRELQALPEGKLYELITPFLPAPLIDTARQKGYLAYTVSDEPEKFKTYFKRA